MTKGEFVFDKKLLVLEGVNSAIYVRPSLNVADNNNATYTVSVENGKIKNSEITAEVAGFASKFSDIDKNAVPNIVGIAKEINNGRIEISISAGSEKIVIETKAIILSSSDDYTKVDFALSVIYEWYINAPKPQTVAQEAWDVVMDKIRTVDWVKVGAGVVIIILLIAAFIYLGPAVSAVIVSYMAQWLSQYA